MDKKITLRYSIINLLFHNNDVCSYCENKITQNTQKKYLISIVFIFTTILSYLLTKAPFAWRRSEYFLADVLIISSLVIFLLFCIFYLRVPWTKKDGDTKPSIQVTLHWTKAKNGLLFPRFRIMNGEIFPACFKNAEGTPISTAYCIMLQKMHWKGMYKCTCQISLVLDEASEEKLFVKGNTFQIYHNYRHIATGTNQ